MVLQNPIKNKLALLDKRMQSFISGYRQNIAIFADDEDELSSLLENYFTSPVHESVPIVHVSTKHTDAKGFFKMEAISILSTRYPSPAHLDTLIDKTSGLLTKTTSMIKKNLAADNVAFAAVLETINCFITENKTPCILIINEFHDLKRIFGQCFEAFANFIIMQRNCMVILASSRRTESQRILSADLNLLFGNFETIYCGDNVSTGRRMDAQALPDDTPDTDFIASFIFNITDNNALYYNHLFDFVKANAFLRACDDVIVTALENTIYNPQTYLYQKFIAQIRRIEDTHKQAHSILQTLSLLSKGYMRKSELAQLCSAEAKIVDARLSKLSQDELIVNYGNLYKIKDRLFSFWLANVFSFHAGYTNGIRRKMLWQEHIRHEISLFKAAATTSKIERICRLTKLFQDDHCTIGSESYKLPAMQRTTLTSYPKEQLHLIVGEGKEIIVMGIKDDNAKDSDVFSFAQKGNNIRGKGVRKFFVSLGAMPDAARLAAKNHKFSSWNVNEINQVMKLYNQPLLPNNANTDENTCTV